MLTEVDNNKVITEKDELFLSHLCKDFSVREDPLKASLRALLHLHVPESRRRSARTPTGIL